MKTITTELVESGEKTDAQGRKLIRARERKAMIEAYEQSGLTQKAFAQREGVKYSTFTAWLLRYRQQATEPTKSTFAEVRVPTTQPRWALEIALPNGIVIRGHEVQSVTALVGALRAC